MFSSSRIVVCVRKDEQKGRAIVTHTGQLRFINITSKYFYVTTFVIANINVISINRTVLEDPTNTKSHGDQTLHVQGWKAPDDGHNSVRNM
jgi:hypothetical protein